MATGRRDDDDDRDEMREQDVRSYVRTPNTCRTEMRSFYGLGPGEGEGRPPGPGTVAAVQGAMMMSASRHGMPMPWPGTVAAVQSFP